MIEKKTFTNFVELGNFLKKKRRETGERIESIGSKLLIKKIILQNIENGIFNQEDYEKNNYLKGFLMTYMKELDIIKICNIENLFLKNILDIQNSNVSLDDSMSQKSKGGSLIILISLILLGLLFLFWNKDTYYNLYQMEKFLN